MSKIHKRPRKAKKFRSQIVAKWLIENYPPCKAADIGGGKGLLSYLLNKADWDTTVVDPIDQALPNKYKDLDTNKKVMIPPEETVKRITRPFKEEMGADFDLLIGLHAHGSNMAIIDAAKKYKKDFFIIPCCVIDEPIEKKPGINWRDSLMQYAESLGLTAQVAKLGFMGKDIAIYTKAK
jgi:hypothetical protein